MLVRVFGLTRAALSHVSLVTRLRQFLQPAVVGEAAVVNRRIRPENEFDLIRGRGPQRAARLGALNFSSGVIGAYFVPATTPSFNVSAPASFRCSPYARKRPSIARDRFVTRTFPACR